MLAPWLGFAGYRCGGLQGAAQSGDGFGDLGLALLVADEGVGEKGGAGVGGHRTHSSKQLALPNEKMERAMNIRVPQRHLRQSHADKRYRSEPPVEEPHVQAGCHKGN